MPNLRKSFDTEGEKLAYEFMINWLQFDIVRNEFLERKVRTSGGLRLVQQHQEAGAEAMLDLFKHLREKYGEPTDD